MGNYVKCEGNSPANPCDKGEAKAKSGHLRWIAITIGLVLAVIVYLIIPKESLGQNGEVVGGL